MKLIYLNVTRPNLSFVVSQISEFMHAPRISHLKSIDRILRYLKNYLRKEIWMKNNCTNDICDYSNVHWAGSFDRKSTTDFYTFIGENIIT
jgi:hypothetical protein